MLKIILTGNAKGAVFGELLLRISPVPPEDVTEKQHILLYIGCAEANVATALARRNVENGNSRIGVK